jgi:hypothetical protein
MLCFQSPLFCLSKSPVNEPPLQFPHWGPYGERCPCPETSFIYPSGSPSKGALPPVLPCRAPVERDAPFPEPPFFCLSESPVIMHSVSSHSSEELAVLVRFNDVQIVCFLSVSLIYTCWLMWMQLHNCSIHWICVCVCVCVCVPHYVITLSCYVPHSSYVCIVLSFHFCHKNTPQAEGRDEEIICI